MPRRSVFFLLLLLTTTLLIAALPVRAAPSSQPRGEGGWDTRFNIPNGADADVNAVALSPQGDVVIGGLFSHVETLPVNRLARWDGSEWHSIGTGAQNGVRHGNGAYINDLAYDSQGRLYIVGYFSHAGTTPANHIAMWDGSAWHALGSGANDTIDRIAILPDDTLVIEGYFTSAGGAPDTFRIARWDGSNWGPIGSGGLGYYNLHDILAAPNGDVYLGGDFSYVGGTNVNNLARWNGTAWDDVGGGANGPIYDLAWGNNSLYIVGSFSMVGGQAADGLARWDGTQWEPMGVGSNFNSARLAVHTDGTLYIALNRSFPNFTELIRKTESGSQQIEVHNPEPRELAFYDLLVAPDGDLYAAHNRDALGDSPSHRIARWEPDSTQWHGIGTHVGDGLLPSQRTQFASVGSRFYAAGTFVVAGTTTVNGVAEWRDDAWHPLGQGLELNGQPGTAYHVAADGNNLYVTGNFRRVDGQFINNVARWDGAAWHALGQGPPAFAFPTAFAVHNGHVYIAEGDKGQRIHHYDGSTWSMLPTPPMNRAEVLKVAPDGTLYAGGNSGDVLARYVNNAWEVIPVIPDIYSVQALEFAPDGTLYLSTRTIIEVFRWDGATWTPLTGIIGQFHSLHYGNDGILYAAGRILHPNDLEYSVASWNGSQWQTYGNEVETEFRPRGSARAVHYHAAENAIWVGGFMQSVWGYASAGIARYVSDAPPTPTPTATASATVTPSPTASATATPSPTATPTAPAQRNLYLPLIQHES